MVQSTTVRRHPLTRVRHWSTPSTIVGLCSGQVSTTRCVLLQGDLTDPSYFDFITFAQLATISQEIPVRQQAFEVSSH